MYHSFSLDAFRLSAQHIKMYHNGRGHVFHEGYVIGRELLTRLIVYNTVGTDFVAIRRDDRDTSVEFPTIICRVWFVTESLVFGQVGHNKDRVVLGLLCIIKGQADGVFADASFFRDGCHTVVTFVARGSFRLGVQAERLCGLCKDVLVAAIEEGDGGAFAVQA